MRLRLPLPAAALVSALAVSACAAVHVGSHVERGLDFTRYRTFDWGPADAFPTGDPRLDRDRVFQDYVQGAIEKRIAARGFELSTSAPPDLLIHYHASVRDRLDVDAQDRGSAYVNGPTGSPRVTRFEAGTLVIDLVEAGTNRVIWRGWAQDGLEGLFDDRDRLVKTIDEAVTRVLETLPTGGVERADDSLRSPVGR
jgi:uncharacterized protein DUF4136